MFRSLDAERIAETTERLGQRIKERFPGSGLSGVAESLHQEIVAAAETARWFSRPQWWVRGIAIAMIATMVMLSGGVELFSSVADFLQGIDSAVNEIILMSAASYFLISWENRRKRRRA